MKDLFEFTELIPAEVQNIFTDVNPFDEYTYEECGNMLKACEAKGYTFEYGLDAVPFNLKKITPFYTLVEQQYDSEDNYIICSDNRLYQVLDADMIDICGEYVTMEDALMMVGSNPFRITGT